MRREEGGYIVVETILSFTMLVLLTVSILSLINITVVQARIHYALTQAAETISMYSYVLEATGLADPMGNLAQGAAGVQEEIDGFRENLTGVLDGLESLAPEEIGASGEALAGQVGGWIDDVSADPRGALQDLLQFGLYEGEKALARALAQPLVGRYLSNGAWTGDEFLRAFHVYNGLEGLDFGGLDFRDNDSTLLDADGNVVLTVRYELEYTFGALPLPFGPHLDVEQTVTTKSWLGGHGEGYE